MPSALVDPHLFSYIVSTASCISWRWMSYFLYMSNSAIRKQWNSSWPDYVICQFIEVFSSYKDVKVIEFSSMQDAFQGFTDKARCSSCHLLSVVWFNLINSSFAIWHGPMCISYGQERETKFRNRMKRYVGIWCCVQSHDPGHIYYDMYWDEKPGWKPEPPKTREDDHPPWWTDQSLPYSDVRHKYQYLFKLLTFCFLLSCTWDVPWPSVLKEREKSLKCSYVTKCKMIQKFWHYTYKQLNIYLAPLCLAPTVPYGSWWR